MSEFDDFAAGMQGLEAIAAKMEADGRTVKAAALIEDARFMAIGERSAARAFFASLALGLDPVPSREIDTMATDGKRLLFNPEFVIGLPRDQCYGIAIGHETLHCAQQHFARGAGMDDQDIANIAGDFEINELCREAGFALPKDALFPGEGQYKHLTPGETMEYYYNILVAEKKPGTDGNDPNGKGQGKGNDPGGCGGFMPAADQAAADATSAHWAGKVAAAAEQAAKRGDLGEGLSRLVARILKPKIDPWELLRDFMNRIAKTDQSWARLNRRHLANGVYLPSKHSQELGTVALTVDTSGSVDEEMLAKMAGFLESVLGVNPGKLHIFYHHHCCYDHVEWVVEDGPLELTKNESGGTSHVGAFRDIEALDEPPAVILALTDMETSWPADPGIPTIWINVEANGIEPPFGRVVCVA